MSGQANRQRFNRSSGRPVGGPLGRTPLRAPALAHGSGCRWPHPKSATTRPCRWGLAGRGRSRPLWGPRRPLLLFQPTQDPDASPRAGLCELWSRDEREFPATILSWKGQKSARRSLCTQAPGGISSPGEQVSGAELQPGRAGSALRLRRADVKSPPPQPARRYEKVGLCARLSAFAEPWPRWACRPLGARAGAGADAGATTAPASIQVQRSAGSGPQPWPRTLGSTSSSRSSTGQRARRPRSSPRCACPAPHPLPRARSDHARMPGRSRTRAPPSARIPPSPCPLRPSLAHAA